MSPHALSALALGLILLLSGCQGQGSVGAEEQKSKPASPPPREVKATPAAERTVARTVSATGTLAADDQVVLGTKVAGRLAEITVDLGTRVKKGQVIGRLDQSDFKFRVEQSEASLQQARVRLGLSPTGSDERVGESAKGHAKEGRGVRLVRVHGTALIAVELAGFGIIFGAASVYLGLKVGLTVSASIPIAVLAISVFKKMGNATILESNR